MDEGGVEAAGVIFDTDGPGALVDGEAADAVDLADFGEGEDGRLGGRNSVAVEDVKLSHRVMIPVRLRWIP